MTIEPTEAEQNETLEFLGMIVAAYKSGGIELEACLEIIGGAFNAALAGDRAVFDYMREVIQQDKDQAHADNEALAKEQITGGPSTGERYILQKEGITWSIKDRDRGLPAQINGYTMIMMTQDDATTACAVLNRLRLPP